MVKKKDGKWRSVIDYRRINDIITIKEPYPMPRMDARTKAKLMTTFSTLHRDWQTPLKEEDKKKTAFTTKSKRNAFTATDNKAFTGCG